MDTYYWQARVQVLSPKSKPKGKEEFGLRAVSKSYGPVTGPVTGPVGKLFGNIESYPFHNQIHGLVPIEPYALVE